MAVAFSPPSCSSGLVPKSKLLHSPKAQYGFVPKLSHHSGKNPALRAEKPISSMVQEFKNCFLAKRGFCFQGLGTTLVDVESGVGLA